ncbi:Histone deacetylase 11 [Quaeritorhiza haematococci]|nr:Histone deacetylase 11 [Quaeritorhiza haematococci]
MAELAALHDMKLETSTVANPASKNNKRQRWSLWGKRTDKTSGNALQSSSKPKWPLVYSPDYNISAFGLEKLHSFDSRKYGRTFTFLVEKHKLSSSLDDVWAPTFPTDAEIRSIHSKEYLESLENVTTIQGILEVPVFFVPISILKSRVLQPMLLATGGTVLAGRLARKYGWAINLGGGYHHASYDRGGGFCVYADITLCIKTVLNDYPDEIKRVLYLDVDAHQRGDGNGPARDLGGDARVHIMDIYNKEIYPRDTFAESKLKGHTKLALCIPENPSSTPSTASSSSATETEDTDLSADDRQYLNLLRTNLTRVLDTFKPDFLLYNAGTDSLEGDRLGCMHLSPRCIVLRDELVFKLAYKERGVRIAMLFSGGYQMSNAEVIAESIANLVEKCGLRKVVEEQ